MACQVMNGWTDVWDGQGPEERERKDVGVRRRKEEQRSRGRYGELESCREEFLGQLPFVLHVCHLHCLSIACTIGFGLSLARSFCLVERENSKDLSSQVLQLAPPTPYHDPYRDPSINQSLNHPPRHQSSPSSLSCPLLPLPDPDPGYRISSHQ